jgi:serine/threonine protein kinase
MNNNFIESFFDENMKNFNLWSKSNEKLKIDPSEIIYKGTLYKIDRKNNKTKPRYFILTENKFYYLKNEKSDKARGVMDTNWVRLEYFTENESQENVHYVIRFIKNMKYCDFLLKDKIKFDIWKSHLTKVFIQSDFHCKFNAVKMIGKGSFARVYLVENKETGEKFAVKAFAKDYLSSQAKGKESLMNEIKVMKMINNKYVMKLHEIHESRNSIYLVLELLEGGELFSLISKKNDLPINTIKKIMKCLIKALAYLQKKGIMHRDLKPENMILKNKKDDLDNCVVKIVDFGLAEVCDKDEYLFKRCGTPGYVAPEIINSKKDENIRFDSVVDVFSAGIIFYIMMIGRSPFKGKTFHQILEQNKLCHIDLNLQKINDHSELKDLLSQMLIADPKKRITAKEALNHNFFSDKKKEKNSNVEINFQFEKLDIKNKNGTDSFVVRENIINGNIDTVIDNSNGNINSLRQVNQKNSKNTNPNNCRPSIYKYVLMKEKEKLEKLNPNTL